MTLKVKIPCCIATKEIPDEVTFHRILKLFLDSGADEVENDYTISRNWKWFGIEEGTNETETFDNRDSFSKDSDEDLVTRYTMQELLDIIQENEKPKTVVGEMVLNVKVDFEVNEIGGVKDTQGKLRWTLLPLEALKEVVKVLEYGAKKYSADNWQKVEPQKYKEAAFRHWVAYLDGEKNDPETGLSHLAHLSCDILFLLWFELRDAK